MMPRGLVIVAAVLLALSLCACGAASSAPEVYVTDGHSVTRLTIGTDGYRVVLETWDTIRASDRGVGLYPGPESITFLRDGDAATRTPLVALPIAKEGKTRKVELATPAGCLVWYRKAPRRLEFPKERMSRSPHFADVMRDTGTYAWRAGEGTALNVRAVFIPLHGSGGYTARIESSNAAPGRDPDERYTYLSDRSYDHGRDDPAASLDRLVRSCLGE